MADYRTIDRGTFNEDTGALLTESAKDPNADYRTTEWGTFNESTGALLVEEVQP